MCVLALGNSIALIYVLCSVQTEILYLPKTMSRYERPYIPLPGSEKPRRICDAEWRSVAVPRREVRPTTKPAITETAFSNVDVHLSLPHKLHYPSGCSIPFAVTLSGSGLSCANIPQLAAGLKMTLVKTSTAIVRGIVSKIETVVSTGTICRIDEDERHWRDSKPGENARQVVIRGCLETGAKGKDMSWGVRGYAGVSVSQVSPMCIFGVDAQLTRLRMFSTRFAWD